MANWTADLIGVFVQEDRVLANVVYSDGISKLLDVPRIDQVTQAEFLASVRARAAKLASADVWWLKAVKGPIDLTPPTVDPPPDPSPDALARAAFVAAFTVSKGWQRAVAAGLVAPDAKPVTDALALAQSRFDPATMADLL